MEILGQYTNGNYEVTIYDDGTKVRENDLDNLTPSFPESIDVSISEYCENNCGFCYLGCSSEGKHGDIMNLEFLDSLHPYTEVAFNINSEPHPQLIEWLVELRKRNIIPNATIAQNDFMKDPEHYLSLMEYEGIFGLGVSLTDSTDEEFLKICSENPNIVIHLIAGIVTATDLARLSYKNNKVLILGFKNKGRGEDMWSTDIQSSIEELKSFLPFVFQAFDVVSFDNLALKQLNVQSILLPHVWDQIYMGDDGDYTMYVDLVNQVYGPSSTSSQRWNLTSSIDDMFHQVQVFKGA